MKGKVIVEKLVTGPWSVTCTDAAKAGTRTFGSKFEAVVYARAHASPENLVIKTAAGQILRPPKVVTSQPAEEMYKAVLSVVAAKAKLEADERAIKKTQDSQNENF
jgi:hypothetical protein